ncbi:MAG: hypothetical protein DCC57_13195 [Chloroflexi bacterium]|nr:MAG: hypothetical protein DCC57_13195 [Chloroflexota bacterium]
MPRLFLDSSVLFAAIFSVTGGARELLRLSGEGLLHLLVSQDVLAESEANLRAKAPNRLADLVGALALAGVEITDPPDITTVQQCQKLVNYPNDAVVLAAAGVDYFVTLDRQHFLDNAALRAAMPFPLGTPGDCLAWFRKMLSES